MNIAEGLKPGFRRVVQEGLLTDRNLWSKYSGHKRWIPPKMEACEFCPSARHWRSTWRARPLTRSSFVGTRQHHASADDRGTPDQCRHAETLIKDNKAQQRRENQPRIVYLADDRQGSSPVATDRAILSKQRNWPQSDTEQHCRQADRLPVQPCRNQHQTQAEEADVNDHGQRFLVNPRTRISKPSTAISTAPIRAASAGPKGSVP